MQLFSLLKRLVLMRSMNTTGNTTKTNNEDWKSYRRKDSINLKVIRCRCVEITSG